MSVGTYLRVWENTGSISVLPEHEPSIDGAVTRWLHEHRDDLLRLTTIAGEEYVTRASNVSCWLLTTPDGRLKSTEYEKAAADEEREHRVAVGLPWDTDE